MAINPKKHVVPHKHIIGDIVDGVTSNFTGGLIGGGGAGGGGGGWSGGLLTISSGHLPLDPVELINYAWEWINGKWTPHTKHIPTGDSYLKISDSKTGHAADVFLILVDTYPALPETEFERYGPILGVSTGMMVKKDISCGGFVGANQGIVALGSCLQDSFDPPGAWMLHSEHKRINLKGSSFPANPREGWRVIRTDELLGTLGVVDSVYSYQIYERQGSSWVKAGVSTFDNGYLFGASLPSWGAEHIGMYFITVGSSNNGRIHQFNGGSSWTDKGDIDDSQFAGFFDTFTIRRAVYQVPLRTEDYAHLRCANITAHNTNPAADDTYGLGTPDRRWKGLCVNTLYADQIKDPQGNDFEFPAEWDGGTVTKNITIQRADPQLHLDAVSGNPAIIFYDGSVSKMHLGYSAANDRLYINDVLASQTILTLSHNGDLGVQGDLYTAGKLVLRSAVPVIDFAPSGLPAGQEYQVRLESTTQSSAGWLNLYGHLKVGGDVRVEHGGRVNFNVNTTTADGSVVFNLQYLGNTEFMIGLNAMNVSGGYVAVSTSNRQLIFSAGNSNITFWGPVHFGSPSNFGPGTTGQVLTSNGAGNAPTWQAPGGGWNGGTVTENITIQRQEPQLRLNSISGSSALAFYRNGDLRAHLGYTTTDTLYLNNASGTTLMQLTSGGDLSCLGDLTISNTSRIRLGTGGNALGTSGQVLTSNGNSPPSWQTLSGNWNGGPVTENITIQRADPQLRLNAVTGNPGIIFYRNSTTNPRMGLYYNANASVSSAYLYFYDNTSGQMVGMIDHSGNLGCNGNLTVGRVIYPSIHNNSSYGWIGDQNKYWWALTSRYVFHKNGCLQGFDCLRSESGTEAPHLFSDYLCAAEVLSHHLTKTKYHVTYDPDSLDLLICVCGKKVAHPCPEHLSEWNDRYATPTDTIAQAAGYLALEHAASITRLTQKNRELEEHLTKMEQKLTRLIQLATASIG